MLGLLGMVWISVILRPSGLNSRVSTTLRLLSTGLSCVTVTLSPGPGLDICNDNHLGLDESVALQHRRGHNLPTVRCRLLNMGQVFYGAKGTFSILYFSDKVTLKGLLRLKVMEEDLKVE